MSSVLHDVPWASILVGLPIVGGGLALRVEPRRRRAVGLVVAGLVAVLATLLAVAFVLSPDATPIDDVGPALPWLGARWHLGIDELGAPFLPLASFVVLVILIAAPRRDLSGATVPALLLAEGTFLGVYESLDLGCLTVFWIASLIPGAIGLRQSLIGPASPAPGAGSPPSEPDRALRAYGVFLVLGTVPLVIAVALIASARVTAGSSTPFDLVGDQAVMDASRQMTPFLLLALALLVRKAVFPFHSWLPVLTERGPVAITTLLIATHVGAFLAARVMLPLLPDASTQVFPWVADLALASALYGGLLALAQNDLRRLLGFVLTSQLSLVIVGIAEANRESLHGALLQMLALGLTSTGLLLVTAQLRVRVGTTDVRELGGLAGKLPTLSAAFFVLGLAAIGFPGSLMFVSEDLLLHGLLGAHPIEATVLLLVTVLNGITLVRAFYRAFLGAPRRALGGVPDLLPWERAVAVGLVALLLATGLSPTPLLAAREALVARLALETLAGHDGHRAARGPAR